MTRHRDEAQPAHSAFGGSVAARVLRCPASVSLIEEVPGSLRKISAYAERGTACHAAMALLIERERSLDSLVGATIDGYALTRDDIENALRPALAYADALLDAPGAQYYLEHRVVFPGIANCFGTVDLLVRIGATLHVVDFKFGSGVRVQALYPVGDEDVINAQLAFYSCGARHSLPQFFASVDDIWLTIVQPMSIDVDAEMVSSVAVTHDELNEFVTAYCIACEQALAPAPRLERGEHCRFCAARPICPEHTKPLLDLAQLTAPTPLPYGGAFTAPPAKEAYLQLLADGLNLVDAIKDLRVTLHDQAKRALENGDQVPGYALSAGRAARKWHDESAAITALVNLGLARDDVITEVVVSPKQAELRAKARGLKIPKELIASSRSGVSLVRDENAHTPVRGRGEIVRSFSAALAAFQGGTKL